MAGRGEVRFACLSEEGTTQSLNTVSLPQENLQKLVHIEHSVRGQSGLLQPGRVSAAARPMRIRALFPVRYISDSVDGQISYVYRCCLPTYSDKSWSTGSCQKASLWQCAEMCGEPQPGKDMHCPCFYTEQPFDFSLQLPSATLCIVCNGCFPPYILLLKGCNTSRNHLQPGKAQSFIWLGRSLKSEEVICFQIFILTIPQWCL